MLGVVYDPVADEVFYAETRPRRLPEWRAAADPPHVPHIRNAMANVDFKRLTPALAGALASSPPYSSQRNYGAGTLEWCYLAAGRFDLYLHGGQKLWDYAAGSLILEEAGGRMCTLDARRLLVGRSVEAIRHRCRRPGAVRPDWRNWVRARGSDF